MRVIKTKDYATLSRMAGNLIASEIIVNPCAVLGLATGSTPVGTYQRLVELYQAGDVDFSGISSVNLDEYIGLPGTHDQSYRYFMNENLFNHVNICKNCTHVPDGMADPDKEGDSYEKLIEELGGVDLQVLGIGTNGHIGFNEPSDSFQKTTGVVDLTESTIQANARFFASESEVPRQAISMGILTIFRAKKILLLASGESKREIMKQSFYGPITPQVPASILQLHPDVTVIVDEAAGKEL